MNNIMDTRLDVLGTHRQQGTDTRGCDALEAHLTRERGLEDLRAELQREKRPELLQETATAIVDVLKAIDVEFKLEHQREEAAIAAEQRANVGGHLKTAEAINLARLRESEDVIELRNILEAAHRAGPQVYDEAVAIARPRLQKMAATELGIRRSIGGGPTQLTSRAFALLNELPQLGARAGRSRLDVVEARHAERRRQVLAAAASVNADLPRLIQQTALRASMSGPTGEASASGLVYGKYWEQK